MKEEIVAQQQYKEMDIAEETSKQQERADRILDAASELIQRWGYKKTTISDIARQSGIAKSTIYLHWKTREELFKALIVREQIIGAQDMQRRIASDPEGATLHGMMKHWMLAANSRQLVKALFLNDSEILGELSRREYTTSNTQQSLASFRAYLEVLRKNGLIRTDQSIEEQMYILNSIATGFFIIDQYLPDDFKVPVEQAAEMMAETFKRVFEPRDNAKPEELQEASAALDHLLYGVTDQKEFEK